MLGKSVLATASAITMLFTATAASAIDLLGVYRMALKNDPAYLAAIQEHKASGQVVKQARAGLLPTVTFEYEELDTTQDIVSSDNAVFAVGKTKFPTSTYTLTVTQPIFNYASLIRYRQSKSEAFQADAAFIGKKQDMMIRVSELYLNVLSAQDAVELTKRELDAVAQHLRLAKARLKGGVARVTDLHDARARHAKVVADLIEAKNKLDDARQALKEAVGKLMPNLSGVRPQIPLVSPNPNSVEQWIAAALKQNPALLAQQHAVEVARKETRRQRAGHLPTVDLSLRMNNRVTEGTLFGGGSEVDTQDISVRISVPLYQGGIVSSRTKQAAHNYQKSLHELEQRKRAVIREARSAYYGVQSAISKVRALKQSVASQQLALKSKVLGYKSGLYTSLAVLDAQRDLYQAKRDFAKARYDYILNSLKLKRVAGTLKSEDIRAINAWFL